MISALESQDSAQAYGIPEAFSVTDEGSANWVVRKVVEARAYAQRVQQWAEREAERAQREEAFFLSRYGPDLERWLKRRLKENRARRRSVDLPAGRVGLRKVAPKLIVEDEEAALAWAKERCPDAFRETVTVRLSKTALSQHLEATGELPDRGVRLEPAGERLAIK